MSIDQIGLGANAEFLDQSYRAWKQDPNSVSPDMARFFEGFEFAQAGLLTSQNAHRQSAVNSLVFHYRNIGHRIAQVNPLGDNPLTHPDLELANFGLADSDLDSFFDSNHIAGFAEGTLRQIIDHLRETYCKYIGVEYMHIQETAERRWLQERMEGTRNQPALTHEQHMRILWKLEKAETFEQYLHSTFRGQKRFSLEGAEALIPALDRLVERAPACGITELVFGVAHRGRLNILENVLEKSFDELFSEFEDNFQLDTTHGDGDVKYHKGFSNNVTNSQGKNVHVSLTANPSHLEMAGPVTEGKVRAKQALLGDKERKRIIPVLVHGDAAFAGQGIVAETFNLSQLKGYRTGGTIHIVVNNQVGFTTTAADYLSGLYCTDVAKMVSAPIFHVNGDHPEHLIHVMDLALDYRQKYQKDVVIDMWCYRRHGHNETDEPSFTQPLLYDRIKKHPPVTQLYAKELEQRGESGLAQAAEFSRQFEEQMEKARRNPVTPAAHPEEEVLLGGYWKRLHRHYSHERVDTGTSLEILKHVANTCASIPPNLNVHKTPRKQMENLRDAVENGGDLRWADAELLAFGSLLMEGHGVRLSGEDSRRGTFSQRHAVLYDQKTGERFIPLTCLKEKQPEFCCYDSSLAELSILAFDYGYAVSDPSKLIMWEAQFGDFANGAQVIIDQFIVAGESKWGRMSGLVMLLPHGYEGQGPEHSNAWIRRYLSQCAEENIQVVYPSTPAQYFHVLRRQLARDFRKPLIVFTPKSLLRHPRVISNVAGLTRGFFRETIDDERVTGTARRVLFCSGKIYYELLERAETENRNDVAIVRVEQYYPFPTEQWDRIAERYRDTEEWAWVSEEPTNYGAWSFMHALLSPFHDGPIWFIGRARSASPATASLKMHRKQQEKIIAAALRSEPLDHELSDGVGVYTRGVEQWHMKSPSPPSENQ